MLRKLLLIQGSRNPALNIFVDDGKQAPAAPAPAPVADKPEMTAADRLAQFESLLVNPQTPESCKPLILASIRRAKYGDAEGAELVAAALQEEHAANQ